VGVRGAFAKLVCYRPLLGRTSSSLWRLIRCWCSCSSCFLWCLRPGERLVPIVFLRVCKVRRIIIVLIASISRSLGFRHGKDRSQLSGSQTSTSNRSSGHSWNRTRALGVAHVAGLEILVVGTSGIFSLLVTLRLPWREGSCRSLRFSSHPPSLVGPA
jgi:hypothetical protein